MRERLSGAVILIALAVIFIPMLFDEPAPRGERPQPVMTIEQPVEVQRRDLPDPEPPASLGQVQSPAAASSPPASGEETMAPDAEPVVDTESTSPESTRASAASEPGDEPAVDPIAELARAADQRLAGQQEQQRNELIDAVPEGEWAVQVGSFGESSNARRLESNLAERGLPVYSRVRDNGLTTVYVGPFATSREGERVMGELKSRDNLQGLLVRADN
ncbi:SPOR domain-containing protein [Halomonas aquatica]|uniref:SPOR domain-containing protein n=1 Tax=Halomonas aquatica TaxID=3151123 RepID=A0ABV1NDU3_9GAMM